MLVLLLAASGPTPVWVLAFLALLGLGVAAFGVYAGVQNLRQAALLRRVVPLGKVGGFINDGVAVTGEPRCDGDILWERIRRQEWRVSTSHSSRGRRKTRARWETVSTEERELDLVLLDRAGAEVRVQGAPTEVHGTRTSMCGRDGQPLSSLAVNFMPGLRERVLREWLPRPRRLTVVGRVDERARGEGFAIVPGDGIGLLLTSADASDQAGIETTKGILLCALSPVGYLGLVYLLFQAIRGRW